MKKLLLNILILIILSQFKLNAETVIYASITTGCDALTVQFSYTTSTDPVNKVKWTFGDGTESTEISPEHKYTQPGKYLVSLKINDSAADSVAEKDFIIIGQTPNADYTFRDTLGFGSRQISFTSATQPASPFNYSYAWELSDGTSANSSHFEHQFAANGDYTAQLIVADENGCSDTIRKNINVASRVSVPNVFTPNDDTLNDLFIVEGDGKITFSIKIFTRTGLKVFETTAKALVWDGRMFSGEKVRDGIYYYVLESKDAPEKITQSGFFYIYTQLP